RLLMLAGRFALSAPAPCGRLVVLVAGEPPGHDEDGGPVDHGLVVVGAALVVAYEPPPAHQPAEGPLDDPAAADDLEGMRAGPLDDLDGDGGDGPGIAGQRRAVVAAVGPHDL